MAMRKLILVLLIGVLGGIAALFIRQQLLLPAPAPARPGPADAEDLSPEQQDQLLDELASQLS